MMQQTKAMDIRDVWLIVRKRKWSFLVPAVLIFTVISMIAYLLPAIYKSESLILIENQKIPDDYVQSTVTSQVEERLNVINQRIMSRPRLEQIIGKFNLYPEYRKDWTQEDIIQKMREDIRLEPVSAERVDKKSGRSVTFTVAFKLSYEGKDPKTVQAVTGELASLYIAENLKVRVDASAITTQFVSDELKKMEAEIDKIGQTISDFKQQHLDELPEQLQINMANLDRYERYLETTHRDLQKAQSTLVYLKGQLAFTDPNLASVTNAKQRISSPKELLEFDRTRLITLEAKLSDTHPDVIEVKERIARLEMEVHTNDDVKALQESLAVKENELTVLRASYTDRHPDVIRTEAEIQDLKKKIQEVMALPAVGEAVSSNNPAYVNLLTQAEAKKLEIESLVQQEKEYKKQIGHYQKRIANSPEVEKALNTMQSDYEVSKANYRELVNKETQAKISESLEDRQQGERFTIIEPAQLPEEPYKPNRLAVVFIGLVLGVGAGAGAGFLSEYLDQSFSSIEDLRNFSGLPVLAVIPKVVTPREVKRKRNRRILLLLSLVIVLVGVVFGVQAFSSFQFDVFFAKVFREAQKLPMQ